MRPTLPALLALAAAACSGGPPATSPTPEAAPAREYAAHPGFDAYYYPGDAALRAWRAPASPYRWVGLYLPAPCHRETSWSGKRATIEALGWGIAVLYVGQQTWEGQSQVAPAAPPPAADSMRVPGDSAVAPAAPAVPACAPSQLTAARGTADGADAAARAAAEGFAAGTTIFLDVERMERVPAAMEAYVRAWVRAVAADGRYRVGLYCHARNATALHELLRAELAAAGVSAAVPVWVASSAGFDLAKRPVDVGLPFATVWQGAFDVTETWNGVTLRIDANVAAAPSPSAPSPISTPAPPPTPP